MLKYQRRCLQLLSIFSLAISLQVFAVDTDGDGYEDDVDLFPSDPLDKNNVPKMGKIIVYFVLCFGCAGFIAKGVIQFIWESQGVG